MKRSRILYGFLSDLGFLVIGRGWLGCVDGSFDTNFLFVNRTRVEVWGVNCGLGHANFLLVCGLIAAAIFTLDLVDSRVRRTVLAVNLDKSLRKGASRSVVIC
jgi:hypothetical protein